MFSVGRYWNFINNLDDCPYSNICKVQILIDTQKCRQGANILDMYCNSLLEMYCNLYAFC